jgi:ElaB/YqjD/DUF883 family membrane-anchored ribosome-binding protein
MTTTNNLQTAAEDVKDQVVAAIENAKTRAAATADEIGHATRKTVHDAQGATEEALTDATSRAKNLRSQAVIYLRTQPISAIIIAVAAGFLLSVFLLLFRTNRK